MELEMLCSVEEALAVVTEKLDALGRQKEPVGLLQSAQGAGSATSALRPISHQSAQGVGARVAEAVVACLDTPHRFKSGKQVGRYVGLIPIVINYCALHRKCGKQI